MRPLRLTLEGFTSFRERVEVDFTHLDLFAITGPTGAGKSSLVDALVFALYGQVPRVGSQYRQLISHGADRLAVQLDFEVGGRGYRIARVARASGATQIRLEALEGGDTVPLADRVREATEQVEAIVGLDYEAFTRSVVLPQGEFDAFLAGKPEERRKILTALLYLGVYERMQAIAHRRASEARREAEFIAGQLAADYAQATEENLAAHRAALAELEAERERVEADRLALERGLLVAREVRRARRDGETLLSDLAAERSRRESAASQVARLEEGLAGVRRRMDRLQQAVVSSGYDERRLQQLLSAEPRAEELVRLERQREQLETEANQERTREQRLATQREEAERALAASAVAEQASGAELERARRQRDELRRRHVAAELRRHLRPGEPCPVCEQEIDSLPVEVLPALEEAEAQVETARQRLEEERRRSAAAGIQAEKLRAERGSSQKRLDELGTRTDVVRQAREEVRQTLLALGFGPLELAEPVDLRDRVAAERARLADGQRQHQRLEKDRDKLEAERARLDREAAAARAQAEASTAHTETLEARRHDVESALTEARQALARLAREHGWAEPAVSGDGGDEVSELERRRAAAQQRVTTLTGEVERQRTELQALEQRLARAVELRAARERLADQAAVAGRLAQLLQANQLLAYIQEEALARLARDGSRHLLTLSQGRYSLVCEEQEFLVLDHWHADTRRSVRTLSGGETFLASLALALALAEGLASLSAEGRASESLESLFLDEGFGTLDAEALDLVVQAIESLHGGRRLVGVITHIPELAERLPARVAVEPGAGGARIVTGGEP